MPGAYVEQPPTTTTACIIRYHARMRTLSLAIGTLLLLSTFGCANTTPAPAAAPAPARDVRLVRLVTTAGNIDLELDAARAPVGVANFLGYANRGEYNATIFHRTVPGFVIQGGGYTTALVELKGSPTIVNEWQNGLKNVRGTIAMARDAAPDTATREFYFNCVDNARLDSARAKTDNAGYAVFGRVVRGMDVIDAIRVRPTSPRPEKEMQDVPVEPVILVRALRVAAR